jgi:hypothetical protein
MAGKLMALTGSAALLIAMGLGGCTGGHSDVVAMENNSHFEETGDGRYIFTAVMNSQYPADDKGAERLRQRWLRQDLTLSNRCSRGADLLRREVIETGKDPQTGAPVGHIVYSGQCAT